MGSFRFPWAGTSATLGLRLIRKGEFGVLILGINAFHGDSAACLARDGVLAAAVEEERLRRIKHWAGFPAQAIGYCLAEAGVALADVDLIAVNQDGRSNFGRKLRFALLNRPNPRLVLDRLRNRRARRGIADHLAAAFPTDSFRGRVVAVDHHLAHLSSAHHVSPFDEATVVSVDGFGDFASAAWGVGRGGAIEMEGQVHFPHSLGIFYQALTQYLGFPFYGDEYKVMGLAPYGEPAFLAEMEQIVRLRGDGTFRLDLSYFRHVREKVAYTWENGIPHVGELFAPKLEALLGPRRDPRDPLDQRHKDIARSVQAMYEKAFFHLLRSLHARHRLPAVALAGGCAMNSVANGKIRRETPFEKVYIQSAAGDAGGAIGAAFTAWHRAGGDRRFVMDHAYWGPSYSDEAVAALIAERGDAIAAAGCLVDRVTDEDRLCRETASAIAAGKVVGWFQGRLEWGPRALGNRSIVCDPRRADMKDILNAKIKRRESFRPFAPSIVEEETIAWFEEWDNVPFMMQVFQIREEKRALIPAVTHVDGSGRLQTVSAATNPLYHRLIRAFAAETGVPMVLNTSFNENEPVVCTPGEALDCFLRTEMDRLVLGHFTLGRPDRARDAARLETEASA